MSESTASSPHELLVRVGPGTPLGALMREYWIPACLSSELVADGDPLRVMLLGERLVAFRDSIGRVGILDHRCPHRCASLFFGRNEHGGLRCIYHGWKFDVSGQCLEMPNVPEEQSFAARLKARAYPTFERMGLVWVYMGPRAVPPPPPMVEATLLPEADARLRCSQRECSWLQVIEGDFDTSHLGFLHLGSVRDEEVDADQMHAPIVLDRAPRFDVEDTPWGVMGGARRDVAKGLRYWRVTQFLFPFWALIPDGTFEDNIAANACVPMDDTHTMVFNMVWTRRSPPMRGRKDGTPFPGLGFEHQYLPHTADWFGRWRSASNATNDYRLDREVQRTETFTGIDGISIQDQFVTESMGPIVDRRLEHLAPSDLMIARARRRLRAVIEAHGRGQEVPPGVDDPAVVLGARGGSFTAPRAASLKEAYAERLRDTISPVAAYREVRANASAPATE